MATKTRVVGSGNTILYFNNQRIARLDSFEDRGQSPVAQPQPVLTLDSQHPSEIATAHAVDAGTLIVSVREAWDEPTWAQLLGLLSNDKAGIAAINDLPGVQDFTDQAMGAGELMVQMLITNPSTKISRGKTYHGCVITDMSEGETVNLGALTVSKTLTLMYTHVSYFKGVASGLTAYNIATAQ